MHVMLALWALLLWAMLQTTRPFPATEVIAGFMAWQGMHKEPVDAAPEPPGNALAPLFEAAAQSSSASFSCDGRQYCSQMTSCAEATYCSPWSALK